MSEQSLQTEMPLSRIRATATHRQLSELVHMVQRGDMTLNAPYQRGSVWTLGQRVGLIRSILLGIPIPAVVINDRGSVDWAEGSIQLDEPFWAVIDGKQRIETMLAWFSGEFAVPASWFDPEYIAETMPTGDGPYVCFPCLTRIGQRVFSNHATIAVVEGKLTTVREEAEVFCLVNGEGTPMTTVDMCRAAAVAGP